MEKDVKGITAKKDEDFSEWYTQVIQKSELADYSDVKGFMVIRPNAYSIWETIQKNFDEKIKKLGVRNAYFPLLIPESLFKRESQHAIGFSPEVAWVENSKEESERLAIRTTSETIIYNSYSKWIRSWRDLPLRINQWCNILRWETKTTRLFLRTREFLWQEGHCVYETFDECEKETLIYLKEYKKLCEELLAIYVLDGKKTKTEKFAGAYKTYSIESLMPDGRALQMGTSHNLGQGFAKSFNIHFIGRDEKNYLPWQNSWGISTRLIGALVMVHGDDKGLVIPPRIASNKVVIIPIILKKDKDKIIKKARDIFNKLNKFNPIFDDREEYSPGWKFNEWELKGIPIRIEIGPKDLEKNQVVLVRRDNSRKEFVKEVNIEGVIEKTLNDIQNDLYKKSKDFTLKNIIEVKNMNELKKTVNSKKIALVQLCESEKCEKIIKDETDGAKTLNIPSEQQKNTKNCISCGKKSSYFVRIAKSY